MKKASVLSLPLLLAASLTVFGATVPPRPSSLTTIYTNVVFSDSCANYDATTKKFVLTVPASRYLIITNVTRTLTAGGAAGGVDWKTRLVVEGLKGNTLYSFRAGGTESRIDAMNIAGSCWLLDRPFPSPQYAMGGDIWVTNDVVQAEGAYLHGSTGAFQLRVEEGQTLSCRIWYLRSQISKTGGGTVRTVGGLSDEELGYNPVANCAGQVLSVEEGVWDMSARTVDNFFFKYPARAFRQTVEVGEGAVLRLGDSHVGDLRDLVLRGGRVESGLTGTRTGVRSAIVLNGNLTVLPSALPSVIAAESLSLSCCGYENVFDIAEGATLRVEATIKPGYTLTALDNVPDEPVANSFRRVGRGRFELPGGLASKGRAFFSREGVDELGLADGVTVPADLELEIAGLLAQAAVWIDAQALRGYAEDEFVNSVSNRGSVAFEFRNPVNGQYGLSLNNSSFVLSRNGSIPGPQYRSRGLNGRPSLYFSGTNALYATAHGGLPGYENIGGGEMSVFFAGAFATREWVDGTTETPKYGLVDMSFWGSPFENYSTNRLAIYSASINMSCKDSMSVSSFPAAGTIWNPRVCEVVRQGRSAETAFHFSDDKGSTSAELPTMELNRSNRVDIVCLGGMWHEKSNGPYCRWYESTSSSRPSYESYSFSQGRMSIGHIGELLVFDRKLTDLERAFVSGYLRRKWLDSSVAIPSVALGEVRLDVPAGAAVLAPPPHVAGDDAAWPYGVTNAVSFVKTGAGALGFAGAAPTMPLAVEGGAIEFLPGAEVRSLTAASGVTVASTRNGPLDLDFLTLGAGVTLSRTPGSTATADFAMFRVAGAFAIGAGPTFYMGTRPDGIADVVTYGSISAPDPLEWTLTAPPGVLYQLMDDRATRRLRLDPIAGSLILFR